MIQNRGKSLDDSELGIDIITNEKFLKGGEF